MNASRSLRTHIIHPRILKSPRLLFFLSAEYRLSFHLFPWMRLCAFVREIIAHLPAQMRVTTTGDDRYFRPLFSRSFVFDYIVFAEVWTPVSILCKQNRTLYRFRFVLFSQSRQSSDGALNLISSGRCSLALALTLMPVITG